MHVGTIHATEQAIIIVLQSDRKQYFKWRHRMTAWRQFDSIVAPRDKSPHDLNYYDGQGGAETRSNWIHEYIYARCRPFPSSNNRGKISATILLMWGIKIET